MMDVTMMMMPAMAPTLAVPTIPVPAAVVEWLNAFGADLLAWLLVMNGWTLALVLAALAAERVLARHVPAAWRIALYAVVAARLLLPVAWGSPIGVVPALDAGAPPAVVVLDDGAARFDAAPVDVAAAVAAPSGAVAAAPTWAGAAAAAYFTGVVVLFLGWMTVRARLGRTLRHAVPARAAVRALAPGLPVVEASGVGPALVGLFRPRVVVPRSLAAAHERGALPAGTISWMLRHEEAHLRRGDHVLAAACQLVCIVAWPVPAVWIGTRRVRRLMEMACDERVLRGADAENRRSYAQTLLDVADRALMRRGAVVPGAGLLGGASMALHERIRSIARPGRPWSRGAALSALLALAAVMLACSTERAEGVRLSKLNDPDGTRGGNQVLIEVHVIADAPAHPKIGFALGQTHGGERPPGDPKENHLSPEEFAAYLATIQQSATARVISTPRLLVRSGQEGSIRIGETAGAVAGDIRVARDSVAAVDEGTIEVTVTPVVHADGTITVRLGYTATGLEVGPPASSFADGGTIGVHDREITIREEGTSFVLATGYIGAPMHLIGVSVRVVDAQKAEAAPAAIGDDLTHFEYYTVIWDVPFEPVLAEIAPGAGRARAGGGGENVRLEVVDERTKAAIFEWWRAQGTFRLGGKDGARLEARGTPASYRVARVDGAPETRLTLEAERAGARNRIGIDGVNGSSDFSLGTALDPGDWALVTTPLGGGTWRMALIHVERTDPGVFRGQTSVETLDETLPAPLPPPRPVRR